MSISLNSTSKFKTRDLPSLLGYLDKKGTLPKRLVFSLAALISFYQGTEKDGAALKGDRNGQTYLIQDSPEVLARFAQLYGEGGDASAKAARLAKGILSESSWWGQDLTKVPGLEAMVAYRRRCKASCKRIWPEDGLKRPKNSKETAGNGLKERPCKRTKC
jgi:tagaturonate reductase